MCVTQQQTSWKQPERPPHSDLSNTYQNFLNEKQIEVQVVTDPFSTILASDKHKNMQNNAVIS